MEHIRAVWTFILTAFERAQQQGLHVPHEWNIVRHTALRLVWVPDDDSPLEVNLTPLQLPKLVFPDSGFVPNSCQSPQVLRERLQKRGIILVPQESLANIVFGKHLDVEVSKHHRWFFSATQCETAAKHGQFAIY